MGMVSSYDKEALRLAKLPRAERFEELLDFPTEFTFKVIGSGEGFLEHVRHALKELGHEDVVPVVRASAKGRYVSVSITMRVEAGSEIDQTYSALEQLPGLAYIL